MKDTPTIISMIAIVLLGTAQSLSATTVIRAEVVQFEAENIQYQSDETFVITALSHANHLACDGQVLLDPRGHQSRVPLLQTCQLPVPHFALDSAELSQGEIDRLLKNIHACKIGLDNPVHVTGHTCRLGTETHNHNLSLRRAARVADLLRQQGYIIGGVTGKGPDEPVAGEDHLELNRRVELTF